MCGIAGFAQSSFDSSTAETIARRMADAIVRRGPDAEGLWFDQAAGIALAHRRLAVVELSRAGSQPMTSHSGRYAIVFNGEIYNHLELRKKLQADGRKIDWRGHSDTESLLAAIEAWGCEAALRSCRGMFALALWDTAERRLQLARDRIGEKPLYFGWHRGALLFGSELAALRAHPTFDSSLDEVAVAHYLNRGYVPAPLSIHRSTSKLAPGTIASFDFSRGVSPASPVRHTAFWSLSSIVQGATSSPFSGSAMEAEEGLVALLTSAVREQMVADVPVGAFLSGGIDSSITVAVMQSVSSSPVKTFTVGFDEPEFDESEFAAAVARALGTDHTEVIVGASDALALVEQLPGIYSEPFADSSQLPTLLISRLARSKVTVALSGDGGDETFGGYDRYFLAQRLWTLLDSYVPRTLRPALALAIRSAPVALLNKLGKREGGLLGPVPRRSLLGDDLHKGVGLLNARHPLGLYTTLISHTLGAACTTLSGKDEWQEVEIVEGLKLEFPESAMLLDSLTYLPEDVLAKVDRAAMSVGLETRIPLLDPRILEFAWSLPAEIRLNAARRKPLLREVLKGYLPEALYERPKMGFSVPISRWLRGALKPWAEELLLTQLPRSGLFDAAAVGRLWTEHQSGRRDWRFILWNILVFLSWQRAWQKP